MSNFISIMFFIFSASVYADLNEVTIKAKVASFNNDTVTLVYEGKRVILPRSNFKKEILVFGTFLELKLSSEKFTELTNSN